MDRDLLLNVYSHSLHSMCGPFILIPCVSTSYVLLCNLSMCQRTHTTNTNSCTLIVLGKWTDSYSEEDPVCARSNAYPVCGCRNFPQLTTRPPTVTLLSADRGPSSQQGLSRPLPSFKGATGHTSALWQSHRDMLKVHLRCFYRNSFRKKTRSSSKILPETNKTLSHCLFHALI